MKILFDEIVGHAGARADGGLAITKWIPGNTDSRIEVAVLRIDAGLTGEPVVAREGKAGGRSRYDRALGSGRKLPKLKL